MIETWLYHISVINETWSRTQLESQSNLSRRRRRWASSQIGKVEKSKKNEFAKKILRSVKEWKDSSVKLLSIELNQLFPSWIKFKVLFSTPSQWRRCLVSPSWWRRGRCWTVCKHPLTRTRSTPGNNMPFLSKEESSVPGYPRVGWPPVVTLRSISHRQGWSQWGKRSRMHLSDLSNEYVRCAGV